MDASMLSNEMIHQIQSLNENSPDTMVWCLATNMMKELTKSHISRVEWLTLQQLSSKFPYPEERK